MSASATSPSSPSRAARVGRVIGWSLITTAKVLFVMAIVALVLFGAYAIGTAVDQEVRLLQRRLALLEHQAEQATLNHEAQATEITALESELASTQGDLDSLATDLAADIAHQETMLGELENQLGVGLGQTEVISDNVALLTDVAVAMQGDIISNTVIIDSVIGETESLQSDLGSLESSVETLAWDVTALDGAFAEVSDTAVALEEFEQALTLFRAWELLSRARLRLVENNLGLAAEDILAAQTLLGTVNVELPAAGELTPVELLQQRLDLVITALPDDPDSAAADLELAWEQLDAIVSALLAPAEPTEE